MRTHTDFLVVGSGVAGLSFALEAAKQGEVTVLTKRSRTDAATAWAQGGIAAVLDPDDTFEDHIGDTLKTGGGLSDPGVVEAIVKGGPGAIERLIEMGAEFSKKSDGSFDLTREGGHNARRVIHSGDITGREVQRVLVAAAEAHPNIKLLENHMAIDLIEASRFGGPRRVLGVYALDTESGEIHTYTSGRTVLATGGGGKLYVYTSNPDVATGDGVAMAYRAGAELANMEFFQFHPTCLFHSQAKSFLISEVLRGEGGILRLADGDPFMERFHEMKDLAPRDVVARAIDFEMKRTGQDCVYLDMTSREPEYLEKRFPNIHATCMKYGFDMRKEPLPVVPAVHYMCGGIVVDERGRSSLPGLYAVGEVTCTGLHGANRLASNSLLEGLVCGKAVAETIGEKDTGQEFEVPDWDAGKAAPSHEAVVISQNWDEVRRLMWNYVGIVRTDRRLRRAARRIALLQEEIREYYWEYIVTQDLLELRNIVDMAEVVIASAAHRKESRGLHYTLDYKERDERFEGDTLMLRGMMPRTRRR